MRGLYCASAHRTGCQGLFPQPTSLSSLYCLWGSPGTQPPCSSRRRYLHELSSVFSLDSRAYPGSRQRTCQACFSGGLRDVAQRLRLESGRSSARCLVVVVLRRMVICTAPSTRRGRNDVDDVVEDLAASPLRRSVICGSGWRSGPRIVVVVALRHRRLRGRIYSHSSLPCRS